MSVDAFLDGLSAEASEGVRRLLRQAYDRGFREALASAGQPEQPERPRNGALAPDSPIAAPIAWLDVSDDDEPSSPGVEWAGAEDDADDDLDGEKPATRPILPHATVGTLRKRITKTFALDRFAVDVIVCARGDRDRRQLKSTVRLNRYLVEK